MLIINLIICQLHELSSSFFPYHNPIKQISIYPYFFYETSKKKFPFFSNQLSHYSHFKPINV